MSAQSGYGAVFTIARSRYLYLKQFRFDYRHNNFFFFALNRNQVRKVKHERYENTDEVNAIVK